MLSAMPPTRVDDTAPPARSSRFVRGLRLGMPVFFGYMPVGIAFGIVATTAGYSVVQAIACSGLVIAGAGQFIAVNLAQAGAGAAAVILATGIVNLRYLLFSATLAPYLRDAPRWRQLPLAFTLTDETFGINVTDLQAGTADDFSMMGVGAVSWVGWTLGTSIGAGAASLVGDPTKWGVDFAMPAMFTALLVAQVTGRKYALAGALAAAATVGLSFVLPGAWPMIAGALTATTVAAAVDR